jgi:hypothetical protein
VSGSSGWLKVGKVGLNSRGAVVELSRQLRTARTAAKAAKLQVRIQAHRDAFAEALIVQGGFQLLKRFLKDRPDQTICALR